jgi:murein DD-endopeptidase MepM/ murein hydrolase activator NlpD
VAPSDPTLRHVGRVVDPAAREDGDTDAEPVVELEPALPEDPSGATPVESPRAGGLLRGQELRERLLSRAESARKAPESPVTGAEAPAEADEAPKSYGDLDEIGRTRSEDTTAPLRSAPKPAFLPSGSELSPNWIAVFGALLGVASAVSLLSLVMNLDPKQRGAVATTTAAPAPAASASAVPEPEVAKPKRARTRVPGPWRIADVKDQPGTRVIDGKIGTNSFLKALEGAGIPLKEAYRVLASMKGVRNFDRCGSSDRFFALIDRASSKLRAFEYQVGPEEVYQSREDASGLLRGAKLDLKVEKAQVVGALVLKGKSFDEAADLAGLEAGLSRVAAKALDGHMSLDELEYGDRVRVVVQELTVLGEFGRYTGVEALEIRSSDETRVPFRLYYFDGAGERGYYDAEGHSPYEGGWRKPIKDAAMTSPFNPKRMHPVLKKVMPHNGIDFASPVGTPVGAASFGTVSFVGNAGPSGNLVKISHAGEIETGYAHLSRFEEGIQVGDKVKRLQVIGYVGSTGRSTGPHLHFSASKKGEFFDPQTLNLDGMRTISKASRDAFVELKRKYDALLDGIPLPPALAPQAPPPSASVAAGAPEALPGAAPTPDEAAMGDGEEGELEAAPPAAAAPQLLPPAPGAAPKPAGASAVHLSDKELMELQGASDDGEVAE